MPEVTRDVVELYNYLLESRDSTMFVLRARLFQSAELVLFLAKHRADLRPDDVQLNTRAFTWPREMETAMDLAATRLNMRKEFVEGVLKNRGTAFDGKINALQAKIEVFKKKDPPVITMDEMVSAAREIEEISKGEIYKNASLFCFLLCV